MSEVGVDNNAGIVVMEVLLVFTFHFPCNVFPPTVAVITF